jgi:hypothetical protein
MTSFAPSGVMTAILPCDNLDASGRFYNRLGFARPDSERPIVRRGEHLPQTIQRQGWIPSLDRCDGRLTRSGQKPVRSTIASRASLSPISAALCGLSG